jgi:hypothetical protein
MGELYMVEQFKYLGWQVGLTYNCGHPGGLTYAYMYNLLDEMAAHRMNLLSIMMQSYGYFDLDHDGYCWPVQNPKLEPYRDITAINADPKQEFLSKIIDLAEKKGIQIELFLNWGIWNAKKCSKTYPNRRIQIDRKGKEAGWLHCPDSPDAWQQGLDEVIDLLQYYHHPNVTRFAFERISYNSDSYCYCSYTADRFQHEIGKSITESTKEELAEWKISNIHQYLRSYVKQIKIKFPKLEIGLHTLGKRGWGHDPKRFREIGIDTLEPHTIQFKTSQKQLYADYNHLFPNDLIAHVCARDKQLMNYPIWKKSPRILRNVLGWLQKYSNPNLKGILFFNEPSVSVKNKKEIYTQLSNFKIL